MKTFLKLPFNAKSLFLASVLLLALVCYMNLDVWNTRMDYTFGYLAPMFAAYVVFDRKEKIAAFFNSHFDDGGKSGGLKSAAVSAFFGAMMFCALCTIALFAAALYKTGQRGGPTFVMTFGIVWFCFAAAYFASARAIDGSRAPVGARLDFVKLFVFPCFIWLIAVPLFETAEEKISLCLLSAVAKITYSILDYVGFIVEIRGNTLNFPTGSVGVAEACSGIRSLTACLFAGSFLSAVFIDKFWKKAALVISSMVLAFINNILRALFLSIWAYNYGSDSISGFVHDAAGYAVLGLTVVGLFILIPIFMFDPVPKELRNSKDAK